MDGNSMRAKIFDYVRDRYGSMPEYLWSRYPGYAVFRHADNSKWYGIVMDVSKDRLGLPGNGIVDILDVKVDDPVLMGVLLGQPGYFPGWHMNHASWMTILLDGTVPFDEIRGMIDASYMATASKDEKFRLRPPKE
ncbi:MAG: MmcQ/YjbR family DNA-binding protein [Lachnospiraceae bacterium]|nr:MmcQ/YjbR family DNA-binding protein [Lachnospiraceae bacterium]